MFSQRPAHRPAEPNDPRGGRTSLLKLPFERVRRTFQSKSPASDIPVMSASNPFLKNPSLSTSISSDSIEKPKSPWQHSQIPRAIGVTGVRRQSSIKPHGPRENPPSSSATLVGSSSRSTGLWSNSVLGINDENTTSSTTLATVEIPTEWDRVAKLLHTQLTVKELESLSPPVRSRSKGSRPVSVVAPTLTRNRSGTSSIPKPTSSSRLGDATSSSNTSKLVKPSILEVIILALQVALKDNSKRWEITTADGTKVNIRAKFRAFISGLQKVVEFGGSHHMAGAQKGPESVVAVVWNVAKFVLEVDVTNIELLGIVESTFETIYVAMGDCAIHESVISAASAASGNRQGHTPDRRLSSPIEASMAPTDVLQVGLVELYAAILVFAVKAKEYVATAVHC
ncbi:hypothetical protein DFH27DRAFT_281999 [Peziza echinospora]|nr:hypothetical protein DFH27DRAFT_281999 [Peziza echinospora]